MSLQSPPSDADPEVQAATQAAFGSAAGIPSSFQTAFASSGLPSSFLPTAYAQLGQESSYGQADPSNPLRVTDATAADPGYGLAPYSPQAYPGGKLGFGLDYEAALARAKRLDLTSSPGVKALLSAYNGGGDPDYVNHVEARLPGAYQTAMNGASDVPLRSAGTSSDAELAQAIAGFGGNSVQQSSPISYSPPPTPALVAQNANDTSSVAPQRSTRQLLALAGGLLSGPTFGQGLGRGLENMNAEYDQESQQALQTWQAQNTQALYAMNAQRYGGQLALGGAKLGVTAQNDLANQGIHAGQLDEKVRNDLQTGDLKQAGLDIQAAQDNARNAIAGTNAGANATRADAAASNAGTAVVGAPVVPGVTAPQVVGPQGAAALTPGAPVLAYSGPTAPAPMELPAQSLMTRSPAATAALARAQMGGPVVAGGSAPMPAPDGAPAAPAPASPAPQASTVPASTLPGIGANPLSPPTSASSASAAPASPWTGLLAGSNYDGLQGGMNARRPIQLMNAKDIVKEQEGDTGMIEGYNAADRVGTDQLQLLQQFQQQNPNTPLGTGWQGNFSKWLGTQTNNPLLADINKNQQQLTQANYPHGVGQLRVAELNTASALAPGSGIPFDASRHLIQQGIATRAFNRGVLNDRQAWIAANPGEAPEVGFDPMANDYISGHDAYSEDPKTQTITPNFSSGSDLLAFAQAHKGANGRYVHDNSDPELTAAVRAAFGPSAGASPAVPPAPGLTASIAAAPAGTPNGQSSPPPVAAPQGPRINAGDIYRGPDGRLVRFDGQRFQPLQ